MKLTSNEKQCITDGIQFIRSNPKLNTLKFGIKLRNLGWNKLAKHGFRCPCIFKDMESTSRRRCLHILLRVVYGNKIWHEVDFCGKCVIGTWFMSECCTCGSQQFPGIVNARTNSTVNTIHIDLIKNEVQQITDDPVVIETLSNILLECSTRAFKKNVLEWVISNWDHDRLHYIRGRTNMALRSRMVNRSLDSDFKNDGQAFLAVRLAKKLRDTIDSKYTSVNKEIRL